MLLNQIIIEAHITYNNEAEKCNAVYIGQTKRELRVRANEHLKCIQKKDKTKNGIADL